MENDNWKRDLALRVLFDGILVIAVTFIALSIQEGREEDRVAESQRVSLQTALSLEEDLTGRILAGLDLDEIRLSRRDLSGTDFAGTSLVSSDLRGASLRYVSMSGADLTEARLGRASGSTGEPVDASAVLISKTDLTGANLDGAVLRRADLSEALLYGASLIGADLSHAVLDLICYDDTTVWPDRFEPPPPGLACDQANVDVALGEQRVYALPSEGAIRDELYLSRDNGAAYVFAFENTNARCVWWGDYDVWKVLETADAHLLLEIVAEPAGRATEVRVIELLGWQSRPDRTADRCEVLGRPGVDWDPQSFPGLVNSGE